jgi:hypothetical protein
MALIDKDPICRLRDGARSIRKRQLDESGEGKALGHPGGVLFGLRMFRQQSHDQVNVQSVI